MAKSTKKKAVRKRLTDAEKRRIYALSDGGMSGVKIAAKLKRSVGAVQSALNRRKEESLRKAGKPFRRVAKVGSRRAGTQKKNDDVTAAVDRLVAAIRKEERETLMRRLEEATR